MMGTYTAERQREISYLAQIKGPLIEQWYLLHHRMVRVVTDSQTLADQVRQFLYYADLLAENTYTDPSQLPVEIPSDLIWQAGQRLHRPVALTCYLFETGPCAAFPPRPAFPRPTSAGWEYISGVEGPQRARWKREPFRFREYEEYPGVSSRISSALHKYDLYAVIFIEEVSCCQPWFVMRFVFYMILGAMLGYDGYEVIHAGAVAVEDASLLLIGAPGSGKSTLVLSCLQVGMKLLGDDVLFLNKDEGLMRVYAFPEDIGVRDGAFDLLGDVRFMRYLSDDEREKRFVDVKRYFRDQVVTSSIVRLLLFVSAERRSPDFQARPLSAAQAVALLMQEYVSQEKVQAGEATYMFDVFSELVRQSPAYLLWLSPDPRENALRVRALLDQHRR